MSTQHCCFHLYTEHNISAPYVNCHQGSLWVWCAGRLAKQRAVEISAFAEHDVQYELDRKTSGFIQEPLGRQYVLYLQTFVLHVQCEKRTNDGEIWRMSEREAWGTSEEANTWSTTTTSRTHSVTSPSATRFSLQGIGAEIWRNVFVFRISSHRHWEHPPVHLPEV